MRPLPVEAVTGVPSFVLGLSVIRGIAVPVVDLEAVLGTGHAHSFARFVSLKLGERRVAVAVGAVIGMRELEGERVDAWPPLLQDAGGDVADAVGVKDAELFLVLRASRLLPDEIWRRISKGDAPS